jgi:hypothetical protein
MSINFDKKLSLAKAIRVRLKLFTRRLIVFIFTPKCGSCHISEGGGGTAAKTKKNPR